MKYFSVTGYWMGKRAKPEYEYNVQVKNMANLRKNLLSKGNYIWFVYEADGEYSRGNYIGELMPGDKDLKIRPTWTPKVKKLSDPKTYYVNKDGTLGGRHIIRARRM